MKRHIGETLIICSAVIVALCGNSSLAESPPASFEATVPDYVVTTSGELDYVAIPGGEILIDEAQFVRFSRNGVIRFNFNCLEFASNCHAHAVGWIAVEDCVGNLIGIL